MRFPQVPWTKRELPVQGNEGQVYSLDLHLSHGTTSPVLGIATLIALGVAACSPNLEELCVKVPEQKPASAVPEGKSPYQIEKEARLETEIQACAMLDPKSSKKGHFVESHAVHGLASETACAYIDGQKYDGGNFYSQVVYCDKMSANEDKFLTPKVDSGWWRCADEEGKISKDDLKLIPTEKELSSSPLGVNIFHYWGSTASECYMLQQEMNAKRQSSAEPLVILRPTIYTTSVSTIAKPNSWYLCGDKQARVFNPHGGQLVYAPGGFEMINGVPSAAFRNEKGLIPKGTQE